MPVALRIVWSVQSLYYIVTGLSPIVSIKLFQIVTGPKTDLWLVKMVGLLAVVIGGTLALAVRRRAVTPEIIALSIASALAFAAVDVFYGLRGTISPIYLGDAALEVLIVIAVSVLARQAARG